MRSGLRCRYSRQGIHCRPACTSAKIYIGVVNALFAKSGRAQQLCFLSDEIFSRHPPTFELSQESARLFQAVGLTAQRRERKRCCITLPLISNDQQIPTVPAVQL